MSEPELELRFVEEEQKILGIESVIMAQVLSPLSIAQSTAVNQLVLGTERALGMGAGTSADGPVAVAQMTGRVLEEFFLQDFAGLPGDTGARLGSSEMRAELDMAAATEFSLGLLATNIDRALSGPAN